jgi:hypothetical protein
VLAAPSLLEEKSPRHEPQRHYAAKRFVARAFEQVRKASRAWLTAGVIFTPLHPAGESTTTVKIKLKPDRSFMNRGITLDRRCPSSAP